MSVEHLFARMHLDPIAQGSSGKPCQMMSRSCSVARRPRICDMITSSPKEARRDLRLAVCRPRIGRDHPSKYSRAISRLGNSSAGDQSMTQIEHPVSGSICLVSVDGSYSSSEEADLGCIRRSH